MLDRTAILSLALAGLFVTAPAARCRAESPATSGVRLASFMADEDGGKKNKDGDKDEEKDEDHDGDHHEKKESREIEQAVPLDMVAAPILDAVKKEVPDGKITEAELEAKKGKIMYSFDVKTADSAYDVKITVDGRFYSKKVDDDGDDEKDDKATKPAKPGDADKM